MEGIGHVHVRHDLVAGLDQVVGHFFGADLSKAEVGFRIDQAGINRHAARVYDFRAARDFDFARFAGGGDFPARHHQHAIVNNAMGDGQQLAAAQHHGALRRRLWRDSLP